MKSNFMFGFDFLSTYSSLGLRVRPWRPIFYSSFEYALSFSAWRSRVFLCSMFHLLAVSSAGTRLRKRRDGDSTRPTRVGPGRSAHDDHLDHLRAEAIPSPRTRGANRKTGARATRKCEIFWVSCLWLGCCLASGSPWLGLARVAYGRLGSSCVGLGWPLPPAPPRIFRGEEQHCSGLARVTK